MLDRPCGRKRIIIMLKLRPHHIIDIVRNIGNDRENKPHEYGHNQHIITNSILDNINQKCILVIENDDICGPCIHLSANNLCDDILHQLDFPKSKQEYNDNLDKSILNFLNIKPGSVITIIEYLKLIDANIDPIIDICTHPKEIKEYRRNGIVNGLKLLLKN